LSVHSVITARREGWVCVWRGGGGQGPDGAHNSTFGACGRHGPAGGVGTRRGVDGGSGVDQGRGGLTHQRDAQQGLPARALGRGQSDRPGRPHDHKPSSWTAGHCKRERGESAGAVGLKKLAPYAVPGFEYEPRAGTGPCTLRQIIPGKHLHLFVRLLAMHIKIDCWR